MHYITYSFSFTEIIKLSCHGTVVGMEVSSWISCFTLGLIPSVNLTKMMLGEFGDGGVYKRIHMFDFLLL